MRLTVKRGEGLRPAQVAALSARACAVGDEAALWVATVDTDAGAAAPFCGRFSRPSSLTGAGYARASGGAAYVLAANHVYCALALPKPSALVSCDPLQLLNRYVRPALRALTRVGVKTNYFGRDWLSSAQRPLVGASYGYSASTSAVLVELVIGVDTPFAVGVLPSFSGALPAAVNDLASRPVAAAEVVARLIEAYAALATSVDVGPLGAIPDAAALALPAAWQVAEDTPMGQVGASVGVDGRVQLGGEFCVASDRLADLAAEVSARPFAELADLEVLAAGLLAAPSAALFGVTDARVFARVAHRAQRRASGTR